MKLAVTVAPEPGTAGAGTLAVTGAAIELAMVHQVESDASIVSEPYHVGRAGTFMRAAKMCTAAGAGLTVVAGRTLVSPAAPAGKARGTGPAWCRWVRNAAPAPARRPCAAWP